MCQAKMSKSDGDAYHKISLGQLPSSPKRTSAPETDPSMDKVGVRDRGSRSRPVAGQSVAVVGSWGTKIEAIVRHLLWLDRREPAAKSLVFSQWQQVLTCVRGPRPHARWASPTACLRRIVGQALDANGIQNVRLEGSNKMRATIQFRSDPAVKVAHGGRLRPPRSPAPRAQVFMLNSHSQSSGLTLVAATHVFLVEPLLNPAMEQQAIHRVHRIGQTKPTTVHRYLIADTIEQQVATLGAQKLEQWKAKVDAHARARRRRPAVRGADCGPPPPLPPAGAAPGRGGRRGDRRQLQPDAARAAAGRARGGRRRLRRRRGRARCAMPARRAGRRAP
jgi:hypothetical protein